jgi:hypothetical protein
MGFLDAVPDYSNLPEYQNPIGPSAPSIGGDYDWGSFSKGIDWNQTPSISGDSGNRWGEALNAASKYLSSSNRTPNIDAQRKKQQQQQQSGNNFFQVSPEVSVIQTAAQPRKTTVTGGSSGGGIGRALGSIGGAVAGAFIPGVGPGLGATLGGGVGSMFG